MVPVKKISSGLSVHLLFSPGIEIHLQGNAAQRSGRKLQMLVAAGLAGHLMYSCYDLNLVMFLSVLGVNKISSHTMPDLENLPRFSQSFSCIPSCFESCLPGFAIMEAVWMCGRTWFNRLYTEPIWNGGEKTLEKKPTSRMMTWLFLWTSALYFQIKAAAAAAIWGSVEAFMIRESDVSQQSPTLWTHWTDPETPLNLRIL